eukprot:COSAG02_NODE_2179_length_9586_cov_14.521395_3_plen_49_part_00
MLSKLDLELEKVNLRTVIEARIDFGSVVPAHNVSVPFGHVAGCASSFH